MPSHEQYLERCLELALLGSGSVSPNPLVGCVIVYEDKIIGEGWHKKFGGPHAEVHAINSVTNKDLLSKATLYVNLEPCSHTGKTPPCANLIIAHKIPRVVIGMVDPNPMVAGKGIALLKEQGVEVLGPFLEKQCKWLNRRFIKGISTQRPYVILKWAQTANGFISPDATQLTAEEFEVKRHITGLWVQMMVHKWRTMEDAIMVGTQTAITDNPTLNSRAWPGRAPARVLLDRNLRVPPHFKLLDGLQKTFILNGSRDQVEGLNQFIKLDFNSNWFEEALLKLHSEGIQSLVVEGGYKLLTHLIQGGFWDEALVFHSSASLANGISAPTLTGNLISKEKLDSAMLYHYLP